MCWKLHGVLEPVISNIPKTVTEINLSWFLEASSLHLVCSFIAVTTWNEVDRMGLALPDTWFPYLSRERNELPTTVGKLNINLEAAGIQASVQESP